jgi:fructose-1,6-bisphosphatase I
MSDPVGLTLSRFIHESQREHPGARGELSDLLDAIGLAARVIAANVRRAGLANVLGLSGGTNVQGEDVKKLDVLANEAMIAALSHGGHACVLASEEEEAVVPVTAGGDYAVAFDPLDGSGNVDTAMPLGTIFSIYRRVTPAGGAGTAEDFLRRGSDQVAAGYVLYGSTTMFVLACDGVHGFTLDPLVGSWLLTHRDLKLKTRGRQWSANPGNRAWWHPGVAAHVTALESLDAARKRPYAQRYAGCLVADFHRILLEGGVFLYPADRKEPGRPWGKLRLLYECAPMAFIAEKAGGAATDGRSRILDVPLTSLHQRSPLFVGSREDVEEITAAASADPA